MDELDKLKRAFELKVLNEYKGEYKIIKFKKGYVDKGIVMYANDHPRSVIATLDAELKKRLTNPIMVVRAKKKLEII